MQVNYNLYVMQWLDVYRMSMEECHAKLEEEELGEDVYRMSMEECHAKLEEEELGEDVYRISMEECHAKLEEEELDGKDGKERL